MIKSLLAILFGSVLAAQAGLSRLEALSMLETGDRDSAVGGVGEVSRYQMRPGVWKQYSSSQAYHDPAVARQVAGQHLQFLESNFRRLAGREPSEFDIYVLECGTRLLREAGFFPGPRLTGGPGESGAVRESAADQIV